MKFTRHFIEFFVVETTRFVGGTVDVILTRQTCGQRWCRAAESKRRARARGGKEPRSAARHSKSRFCRGNGTIGFFLRAKHVFSSHNGARHCGAPSDFFCWRLGNTFFFSEVAIAQRFSFRNTKKGTDLGLSLLYIWIFETYGKFARENNFLGLLLAVYTLDNCQHSPTIINSLQLEGPGDFLAFRFVWFFWR